MHTLAAARIRRHARGRVCCCIVQGWGIRSRWGRWKQIPRKIQVTVEWADAGVGSAIIFREGWLWSIYVQTGRSLQCYIRSMEMWCLNWSIIMLVYGEKYIVENVFVLLRFFLWSHSWCNVLNQCVERLWMNLSFDLFRWTHSKPPGMFQTQNVFPIMCMENRELRETVWMRIINNRQFKVIIILL